MRWHITLFLILNTAAVFGQTGADITGTIEWDRREINAVVSLDLVSARIKLPSGRTQGETVIAADYFRLIRPGILELQADSSSTVAALVKRGEWSLIELENTVSQAQTVPPVLSPDLRVLSAAYTLSLERISAGLIRHSRPAEPPRILNPVSAPAYTGIIIIASQSLPVHGMKSSALPVPCLFPKIWDTHMNLIFERNMLDPHNSVMVRYAPAQNIFGDNPSGLSPEIITAAGNRPLRIFARGVFGIVPTDPIIDREDALLIISTEENRRLLQDGKVVIILDDSVLKQAL
ncbi:MAG: polymerase [Treponema sp.]|jgi:hypothetical protein|nr:polymerase [Treponema sp.]